MVIWMPRGDAQGAKGTCSTGECSGRRSNIVQRSIDAKRKNSRDGSHLTRGAAGRICNAYIDTYLRKLPRSPSQRDSHYNETIESTRNMCIDDVLTMGPVVS